LFRGSKKGSNGSSSLGEDAESQNKLARRRLTSESSKLTETIIKSDLFTEGKAKKGEAVAKESSAGPGARTDPGKTDQNQPCPAQNLANTGNETKAKKTKERGEIHQFSWVVRSKRKNILRGSPQGGKREKK